MKEKTVLSAIFLAITMFAMMILPAKAWEYWNTQITAPQTDNLVESFGSRADKVQIQLYSSEVAEFAALTADQIDLTDWPVDSANYVPWTTPTLDAKIAVVDTGAAFDMFTLDMNMNPNKLLPDGSLNPAWQAPISRNPMSDVWLRRAIAACIDRPTVVGTYVTGTPPAKGVDLYTPVSPAYGAAWVSPDVGLSPKPLCELIYANTVTGAADTVLATWFLNTYGYSIISGGFRTYFGVPFTLDFYVRNDDARRWNFATLQLLPLLTTTLQLNVNVIPVNSASARANVMVAKRGHLYTGGWDLTQDPDHLYYLYHINNYWHPGRPPNYMYYPGDAFTGIVPTNGWRYEFLNVPWLLAPINWRSVIPPNVDFSDYWKTWSAGDVFWQNPVNYWAWELMIATTLARATQAAQMLQRAIAYYVIGEPVWCSRTFSAFHRTYCGSELPYSGHPWKGIVNQVGLGTWGTMSLYNMHTDNALWGDGTTPMVIRWGFRQPTMSLNPLYAEWIYDWYAMNLCYDNMIRSDPYTASDMQNLAASWSPGTWTPPSFMNLGTCTMVTFDLRHDLYWSDGVQLTASDVAFTWGNSLFPGSISNLLAKNGLPPAYWSSQVADIISVKTPDPFTVIVYLDRICYFGLHSMSGWNIVLPEHVWKPIILGQDPLHPNPQDPWDMPNVCSGGWVMDSTSDPSLHGNVVTLSKNPMHNMQQRGSSLLKPFPMTIWTTQTSNASEIFGNTHYLYPWTPFFDTAVGSLTIDVNMHNSYAYETGPSKTDVYPDTRLDGTMNVEIWKWDKTLGPMSNPANWKWDRTLATSILWQAWRCHTGIQTFTTSTVPFGWYFVKVDVTITNLEISANGGVTWIPIPPTNNPFNGDNKVYNEYFLVTSRRDIGGAFYKPASAPKYQPISDLMVDVKDLFTCGKAFGSFPGQPNWNPACDVDNDNQITIIDYFRICLSYGWVDP